MRATRVYAALTARSLSARTVEWLIELVERFGDDAVSDAIEVEAAKGELRHLLERARDRLARRAITASTAAPRELDRDELLGWARGAWEPPSFPVIYDPGRLGLSPAEYREVERWALARRGMRAPEPMETPPPDPADAPVAGWFGQ